MKITERTPEVFLFDYGGVLAEEGFTGGLKAIAVANGLDPEGFFRAATEIIYRCGYVTGDSDEANFWRLVREEFPISASDRELTGEIHDRFVLRTGMIDKVRAIKKGGAGAAILSDQTDWLEQLDKRDHFLDNFDPVLNSYRLGMTKREPATFARALEILGREPGQVMFVDDNPGHIERADKAGLRTHLFAGEAGFGIILKEMGIN